MGRSIVANLKGSGLGKCEYDFSEDQTWCRTSHNLNFIDETQELVSIYDRDSEPDIASTPVEWAGSTRSAPEALTGPLPPTSRSLLSTDLASAASPTKKRKLDSPFSFSDVFQGSPEQSLGIGQSPASHPRPRESFSTPSRQEQPFRDDLLNGPESFPPLEPTNSLTSEFATGYSTVSDTLARIYLETPAWPLQDRHEAHLMRYFLENLAASFDLCDPDRHFALVVPQRAAVCPTLLNAIFAASARHLSRVSEFDPYVADRYHQECLKHLIPMLSDSAAIMDENLLAATVILRFLEEVEVPVSGADTQSHLLGTHVFISAQERSTVTGGLRQAAFWVGLRQEIYMAFVNQRSILPVLEHCNIDRSFEPTDDCTWANRIVVLCADVIRYCFGDGDHNVSTYSQLLEYSRDWMTYKPASFSPIFYRDPKDGELFPEIWLLSDAVVTGLQHYHLARILLTAHNPKVPRLGPGQRTALRLMNDEIQNDVRTLCGMAESNSRTPPNYVTACMAIAMAGDRFTERREQEALLRLLLKTEKEHAWPTSTAQMHLKEAWGWTEQ
ncbi:hypothetical protein K432DRAFT_429464 [Lepidopterella palustris CBS 459.81]|uniref:Arca-like protein n=1 Tax=Lepidopterella palustris CBS 459.81 TaxID=1314670 RepID=A0A8E2JAJ1_9PEZI|nr:hypothetical protein K432DRAFT_429464 [Lepidopterella palustris CBS 459.81]